MNSLLIAIGILALSFVLGRTIADIMRKRPIRDKQTRHRPLVLFFTIVALIIVIILAITVGIGSNLYNIMNSQSLDNILLSVAVFGFGIYVAIELVRYLNKKLRKKS
ncbi:MAG TPA: hypothetical protein PK990_05480 [Salinivirgaceae bacterium]|nr:hypothetical protein [Salinivirgaceae bacterium]